MTSAINVLRRFVGHRFDSRFTWGELSFSRPRWNKFGFKVSEHDARPLLFIDGFFFCLCVNLWWRCEQAANFGDGRQWGFYLIDTKFVWRWGKLYRSWGWPIIDLVFDKEETLSIDGQRVVYLRSNRDHYEPQKKAEEANSFLAPFVYVLRNSERQEAVANCHVERRTWHRKWIVFPRFVRTSLAVNFNREMGEKAGSWKGGVIGTGVDMRKGETALDALKRMERERKL